MTLPRSLVIELRHGLPVASRLTATSLELDPGLSAEDWRELGQRLARIGVSCTWWIADWALYARFRSGPEWEGRYDQLTRALGLDFQTVSNYAWVAARIPPERRRPPERLSFGHHAEVAALPDDEQELWLQRAELYGWSRRELRDQLRAVRRSATVDDPAKVAVTVLRVQVPAERERRWRQAADRVGIDLSQAVASAVDRWADEVLSVGA